jgi:hypothetical protein
LRVPGLYERKGEGKQAKRVRRALERKARPTDLRASCPTESSLGRNEKRDSPVLEKGETLADLSSRLGGVGSRNVVEEKTSDSTHYHQTSMKA